MGKRELLEEIRNKEDRILSIVCENHHLLEKILHLLKREPAVAFKFTENGDSTMPTDNSIILGQVSNFSAVPVDANGNPDPNGVQPGSITQYASSDSQVALTPSADGSNVNVLGAVGDTNTSFVLTASGVDINGKAFSSNLTVAIQGAAPPPQAPAVGFQFTQNS